MGHSDGHEPEVIEAPQEPRVIQATPEELLNVIKRMFPREFDMAAMNLVNEKQAARIAELEALVAAS